MMRELILQHSKPLPSSGKAFQEDKSEDLPYSSQSMDVRGQPSLKTQNMHYKNIILSAALMMTVLQTVNASSGAPDTLRRAEVASVREITVSHRDMIFTKGEDSIIETLVSFPGLTISDMGGYGGLKTVNIRGMGTANTLIYIDGVRVGNMQSGQNDLGMIDLQSIESVTVDYARNSITFNTAEPIFGYASDGGMERFNGKASFRYGSFGTATPSVRLNLRTGRKSSLSVNATGVVSDGDYIYIGTDGKESFRSNNDIRQIRTGADLFGELLTGSWHVKGFFNSAERGTPGSIDWPSDDRQKDMNTFLQATLRLDHLRRYKLNASAKIAYDEIFYQSSWGDSRYIQTEAQVNTSHMFRLNTHWRTSLHLNGSWDRLESESYSGKGQERYLIDGSVATSFTYKKIAAEAGIDYCLTIDNGKIWHAPSPAVIIRYTPEASIDITAFSRRACRIPTFSELYYIGYGNPDLKSENTWLNNIGIDWKTSTEIPWHVGMKADAFCNIMRDKITSAPRPDDPNIWMPYNIGKVLSYGVDAAATVRYDFGETGMAGLSTRYSLQNTIDKTPESPTYGMQVPYVAKHSIAFDGEFSYRGWKVSATWNLRSERRDSEGTLPEYNTFDAGIDKTFGLSRHRNISMTLSLMGRNLTDCRYELSRGYPMPGRSAAITIGMNF